MQAEITTINTLVDMPVCGAVNKDITVHAFENGAPQVPEK